MPKPTRRASVPPMDPDAWTPTPARPLRAKLRRLAGDTRVEPHSHPWGQVAMSDTGTIRMTAENSTFLVPPSRALWIPPDVEHVVTTVDDADIRTLYLHPAAMRWHGCRVIEVSRLLRELVLHLDVAPGSAPTTPREQHLSALILDELRAAAPVRLGVDLPADKRLRALCEAVLEQPARWATIASLAQHAGASPRTVARLFRSELGTSFGQWRQQVLLAHALSLAARRLPMATIAAELGYASPSAFTAMVKRSLGAPPTRLFS
jgi:AraC-like DNA-binding protein